MANSPQKILITGGAGFIGSSLALGLAQRDRALAITCLDNLHRRGSELTLPRLAAAGIRFVHGDIRVPADLDPSAYDIDTLIDCSAEPSVMAGFSSPAAVVQTNLVGTANLLELARIRRARVLFLSSSRVYPVPALRSLSLVETPSRFELAPGQSLPGVSAEGVSEAFGLAGHRTLYGATKLASELLIEEYANAYGLPTLIDRFGVVTGPGQMATVDQGVFGLWVAAHHFGKPLAYIGFGGTGKQVRDFLHVEDLVRLVWCQLADFDRLSGQVFNAGGGRSGSLSLSETTGLCRELTGREIPIRAVSDERPGDVPVYITDSSRVRAATGWAPTLGPRETLADIHRWICDHEALLRPILA